MSKYSLLRYRKNPKVEPNWRTRGDTLRFFIHSVANKKNERGTLLVKKNLFEKKSHNAEKTERGDPLDFSTSVLSENSKKIEGGTLWGIFFSKKKSHSAENTLRQYPLVLGPFEFLR